MSTETPEISTGFEALGLKAELLATIKALGYTEPTPVQKAAIPAALEGRDVLGQAATGTGKTAAFALPMLHRMTPGKAKPNSPFGLVVVPTRELAMQVAETIQKYGKSLGFTSLAIYGGQEMVRQIRPLSRGVDIVVATPGRALDHLRRKTLKLDQVQTVVLDEADEMLDLGFADDLDELLSTLPPVRQTALFSATLPSRIAKIAEKHLKDPVRVRIESEKAKPGSAPRIRQMAYLVPRTYKDAAFARLLDAERPVSAIVFCRTREEVERVGELVGQLGLAGAALHGGMSQEQRDRVLKRFKGQSAAILIATDVAARGLDVQHVSHVFNYDVPNSSEVYVHRIGRTGRAGREGRALTLLEPKQRRMLQGMERASNQKIDVLPIPSVDQVRTMKIERLVAQVETALSEEVDPAIVTALAPLIAKSSADQVAASILSAMYSALNPANEGADTEIPAFASGPASFSDRGDRGSERSRGPSRFAEGDRPPRSAGERVERSGARPDRGAPRGDRPVRASGPMTRFVVRLGARAGVRPSDLVGAIANEADIPSRDIGGIVIQDGLSFVEVANVHAAKVADIMKSTSLRGRKASFEIDKSQGASAAAPEAAVEVPAMARSEAPPRKVPGAFGKSEHPRTPRVSAPKHPRVSAPKAPKASAPKAPRASAPKVSAEPEATKAPRVSAPKHARPHAPAAAHKSSGGHTPRSFSERDPQGALKAYETSTSQAKAKAERLAIGAGGFSDTSSNTRTGTFGAKKEFGSKPFGDRKPFEKKVFGTPSEAPRFGGEKKPFKEREFSGPRSASSPAKKFGDKPSYGKPAGDKPFFKKKKY